VREALFSTLESMLSASADTGLRGIAFLDLYAGSGAVGLEAASRGAQRVVLVERDPGAATALRRNAAALHAALSPAAVEVRLADVGDFLAGPATEAFDIVFVDPPYATPVDGVLASLAAAGWLADRGVVVVERASRDDPPAWPEGLQPHSSRRYGDTALWYALWYGRRP
jgi:16S rRNA (guanine966-N2)-methyltransferase